jgi:RimJ/RimL family protein N-acetyltransferase
MPGVVLTTPRLVLRPFSEVDKEPFFELSTHPAVVESLGWAPTRAESDATVERYAAEFDRESWGRWAAEVPGPGGAPFVGVIGLRRVDEALPCAPGVEVGWRLHPDQWGHGYATEGASASLRYGFDAGLEEIVAFTTTLNTRSQAVMTRLGMAHVPGGDFDHPGLPEDSPLRRHVLYRVTRHSWRLR